MSQGHAPTPPTVSHDLRSGANTRIPKRWLWVARVALLAISALALVVYIAGTPVYFAQLFPSHHDCVEDCLTPANVQSLHALGISITTYAVYWVAVNLLFALVYFAVAALIFWRKSDDWMAWLASFSLVTFGASFPSIPGVLAAVHPAWWLPVTIVGNEDVLGFPSLIIFFFLFPNGRFVPRWTRWVAIGFTALFVLAAFFPRSSLSFSNWLGLLFVLVPPVLVFAQVYRYRRVSTLLRTATNQMDRLRRGSCAAGIPSAGCSPAGISAVVHAFAEHRSFPHCHPGYEHLPGTPADPTFDSHCHPALSVVGCGCAHQQDPGL